jgi:hypothetical protein
MSDHDPLFDSTPDRREHAADEAIRRAIVAEASVPTGLEGRILSRLAEARLQTLTAAAVSEPAPAKVELPADPPRGWSWRFTSAVALAGVLLLAAIGVGVWHLTSEPLTREAILASETWRNVKELDAQPWQAIADETQASHPYPFALLAPKPADWQACTPGDLGASGVVYRLKPTGLGLKRAYLFVLHPGRTVTGLAAAPQPQPLSSTGGWSLAAWRQDDVVYVLLAEGPTASFPKLFRGGPVAA